jgi:HEAT repeat protein
VAVETLVRFLSDACDVSCRLNPGGPPLIHVPVALPEAKPEDVVSLLVASGHSMQLRKLPNGAAVFDVVPPRDAQGSSLPLVDGRDELQELASKLDSAVDELKRLRASQSSVAMIYTGSVSELLRTLRDGDSKAQAEALEALLWNGADLGWRGVPPAVLELVASSDERVRSLALEAVSRWGLPLGGRAALAVLLRKLKDSDEALQARVAAAIGLVAEQTLTKPGAGYSARVELSTALPPLLACLLSKNAQLQSAAARALAAFGADARDALGTLGALLESPDPKLCFESAAAMASIAGRSHELPLAEKVVQILIAAVREGTDLDDRVRACESLGRLGPAASAALQMLHGVTFPLRLEEAALQAAQAIERP